MLRNLGNKAVKSDPAETELAAILTPSCANVNDNAMKKTPALVAELAPSPLLSRNLPSKSSGFHISSP